MRTFLGIEGGGSHTAFLLVDENDREIAHCETGPSNYNSVGTEQARRALEAGIRRLPETPDVVSAAMAGGGNSEGRSTYRKMLADLVPSARIIVDSDIQAAATGALGDRAGIVLIAGTGSIVMGRLRDGTTFRHGGWGPQFGDEGSGYWIGREAIRTALAFVEDRRRSEFPALVARSLGVDTIAGVIPACADGRIGVARIASLAEHLLDRYPEEPGTGILKTGAEHLRRLVERATFRFGSTEVPIVALGGVASQAVIRKLIGLEFVEPEESALRGAIRSARLRTGTPNRGS